MGIPNERRIRMSLKTLVDERGFANPGLLVANKLSEPDSK
jgi:hypothetical protein